MMRIAVENSTWNNIGDAFYQISLKQALTTALPHVEVVDCEGPINRAFRPRRFQKNAYDIRDQFEADHYIFSGPILSKLFMNEYAPLIRKLVGRGQSYSLLSVHAYAVGEDLKELREFFEQYPPITFHTRDSTTFEKFPDICDAMLDGICFAFFVRFIEGISTIKPKTPYVCSSFHSRNEPNMAFLNEKQPFETDLSNILKKPSDDGWRFKRHIEWRKSYPNMTGDYEILRTVHGFYPFPHLLFARPNSFITYNPKNFLTVYRHCSGVITDRVHAGVAALSFGNPAAVSALDGRFALFDNAPVVRKGSWMHLDEDALLERHEQHIDWIRGSFGFMKS